MKTRSLILVSGVLPIILFQTGCSAVSTKSQKTATDQTRIRQLETELKKRQTQLEDLQERNIVLEKRVKTHPAIEVKDQMAVPGPLESSVAFAPRESNEEAISLARTPSND